MKLSRLRLFIFSFLILLSFISAFLFGFVVSEDELKGHSRILQLLNINESENNQKYLTSIFTELKINSIEIPTNRIGTGGGLTSFKNELVLINHEGQIFTVNESEYNKTRVLVPDNGFGNYKKSSLSIKNEGLIHVFEWFRYNDILHYTEEGNDYLVVSYTEWIDEDECYGTSISRVKLPKETRSLLDVEIKPSDWELIYRTSPCLKLKSRYRAIEGHMAGGRIAYHSEHKIVLGSGDYHWDGVYAPQALAQSSENDYGKVVEIDLETRAYKHLSIGNRNMQGIVVDKLGQVWVAEHGVRGGDELNLIENNQNYGWPKETLGTAYNKMPWPMSESYGRHDKYVPPVFAWIPSVAISGMTQIKNFHSGWDDDFLISSLAAKKIFRVRIKDKRVLFSEPIDIGERIRYVHQHNNGQIVLWTDSKKIQFITPFSNNNIGTQLTKFSKEQGLNKIQQEKFLTYTNRCLECHEFNNYSHEKAPPLGVIFNRKIASTKYDYYSEALLNKKGEWNKTNLKKFLKDTQSFVPGSMMPNQNIDDQEVLESIIAFLEKTSLYHSD